MLIVSFSIAVEVNRADETRSIMNDYGVAITNEVIYDEKLCWNEAKSRVYFECFAPISRVESLTEYLDNTFTGTAILSY